MLKKTILKIKYIIITLILFFNNINVFSQSPQAFKYQAIVRGSTGNVLTSQNVRFRLSILQGSVGGPSVYVETQYITTNQFGMVDLAIGNGTYVSGNFSTISWGTSIYFLKTELDPSGGTTYTTMGTTQLLSVPYALYAGSAGGNLWSPNGNNIYNNNTGNVGIGTNAPTSKLAIKQTSTNINDTLFVIKDNIGNPVFAVFPQGVRVYVPDLITGTVGGFAVSGRGATKGSGNYLLVNHDSTRIYTNEGFGIGNISGGPSQNYLKLTPANYFIGHETGVSTTGSYNLFLGYQAGRSNIGGQSNIFIGYHAGLSNTDGLNNVFIGHDAGSANIGTVLTGLSNVFIGTYAGNSNTYGNSNVFIGEEAGKWASTGDNNLYIGKSSYGTTTGSYNVCLGYNSRAGGNNVTAVGSEAGYNSTGSNCVFLGYRAGYATTTSNILIIENTWPATSPLIWGDFSNNKVVINGNSSNNINNRTFFVNGSAGGTGAWWNDSDERLKKDIITIKDPLKKIMALHGVNYQWQDTLYHDKGLQIGFIAQEVINVLPEVVSTNGGNYSMQYAPITALLVEAMKEQQKQIELLQIENDVLKKDNASLNIKVNEINNLSKEIEKLKALIENK